MSRSRNEEDERIKSRSPPKVLVASQLLLFMILFRYSINFLFISYPANVSLIGVITNFVNIAYISIMSILAVEALLGLTSAKPQSWRKVVRSSLILSLTAVFMEVLKMFGLYTSSFNFGLELSVGMTVLVLLIMFLPHVRRFYIPPFVEVPPLKNWILFIFATPIVTAESYRFTYGEDQKADVKLEE